MDDSDATHPTASDLLARLRAAQVAIAVPDGGLALRGQPVTVKISGVEARGAVGALKPAEGYGVANLKLGVEAHGEAPPEIAVGFALLDVGGVVDEGQLIKAVTPVWWRIIEELDRDPAALLRLDARQGEQLVAGGWRAHGWQVTLTPRSGDGGVDVIATRDDISIRVLDQVKLYTPGHLVTAKDVREMWGVLDADRRAAKAYVTTTSAFAPGVYEEFADRHPWRIELRDGVKLREWLMQTLSSHH